MDEHMNNKGEYHAKRYWDYRDMNMLENKLTHTTVVTYFCPLSMGSLTPQFTPEVFAIRRMCQDYYNIPTGEEFPR